MPTISIDLASVASLQSAIERRRTDIDLARLRLQRVRADLDCHVSDRGAREIEGQIRSVETELARSTEDLSARAREIEAFVTRIVSLDASGPSRGALDRVGAWAGRLREFERDVSRELSEWQKLLPDPAPVLPKLPAVGNGLRAAKAVKDGGSFVFDLGKRAGSLIVTGTVDKVSDTVGAAADRLMHFGEDRWRTYDESWDRAFATYRGVTSEVWNISSEAVGIYADGVREVGKKAEEGYEVLQEAWEVLAGRLRVLLTTKIETVDHDPEAEKVSSEIVEVAFEIDIPLGPVDVRLAALGGVEVADMGDGTLQVTLTAEFGAGIAKELEMKGMSKEAALEAQASIMATLGQERTYSVAKEQIDGRPVWMLLVEQQVARAILQGVRLQGGVGGVVAGEVLRHMAPEPEPMTTSTYLKVTAAASVEATLGGVGAKAGLQGEVEARHSTNDDGSGAIEFTARVEGEAAASYNGKGALAGGGMSVAVRATYDENGIITGVERVVESTSEIGGATSAAFESVDDVADKLKLDIETTASRHETRTETTTLEIPPHQRDEFTRLVASAAGVGDRMPDPAANAELLAKMAFLDEAAGAPEVEREIYTSTRSSGQVGQGPIEMTVTSERRLYDGEAT